MNEKLITRDMLVSEVVANYPTTVPIMLAYGLHCVDCGAQDIETIAEGTVGHGMSEDELELLLTDLNEEAEKQEKLVLSEKEKHGEAEEQPVK